MGSGGGSSEQVYEGPAAEFISEVAVNPVNTLLALKTNNALGYEVPILLVDPQTGLVERVLIEGVEGAFDGLDFSSDGERLLYSRDVSGLEGEGYRRLDNRIFEYDLPTDAITELDTNKPVGQNDLDPKYAPNDGYVIYTRTSNDGVSEKTIQRTQVTLDETVITETLFTDAYMPSWE